MISVSWHQLEEVSVIFKFTQPEGNGTNSLKVQTVYGLSMFMRLFVCMYCMCKTPSNRPTQTDICIPYLLRLSRLLLLVLYFIGMRSLGSSENVLQKILIRKISYRKICTVPLHQEVYVPNFRDFRFCGRKFIHVCPNLYEKRDDTHQRHRTVHTSVAFEGY